MPGRPPAPDDGRSLLYYARIYDELHQGETYTAEAFVAWLIREIGFESDQKRAYRAPAGRPGQMKVSAA